MDSKRVVSTVLCVLVLAAVAAPVLAKQWKLDGIALQWKPTEEIGDLGAVDLTGLFDVTVRVERFTDSREDPQRIGENQEDAKKGVVKPVVTTDDVAEWATERFMWVLDQFGISSAREGGDVVVEAEIKRFFVAETKTYQADVGLLVTVKSTAGEVRWQGMAGGSSSRFGRSYKAENYYECLSDAYLHAVGNLLQNVAFTAALKGD